MCCREPLCTIPQMHGNSFSRNDRAKCFPVDSKVAIACITNPITWRLEHKLHQRGRLIELGLALDTILPWFTTGPATGYTRVSVPPGHSITWPVLMENAVRRAYISDERLEEIALANGIARAAVLATKLPGPGSVMSGDFGEIVGYIYLAAVNGGAIVGPKRWRLKEDRTKSAPYSDVVQFVLPHWPDPSADDSLVCAEVKAKATPGSWAPLGAAVTGMNKDRTSRLSKTLVWLRERAISADIGAVTITQLDRFIHATEFPPYRRRFSAIGVICSDLVDHELEGFAPPTLPADCALIVIDVPHLRETYTAVYEAAHVSVQDTAAETEVTL
jgi:hypothetical protein